jgi:hypothetical protein
MAFWTTNEMTPGHGVSPISHPLVDILDFKRAFLIYIRLATKPHHTGAKRSDIYLRIRQFYYDYDKDVPNSSDLIEHALRIGRLKDEDENGKLDSDLMKVTGFSTKYVKELPEDRRQFPYVFAKDLTEVNFGWEPCEVIFIFDNADFQFIESDSDPDSLKQPIVFRKTKAIEDKSGKWVAAGPYEENYSFFNLETPPTDNSYSAIVLQNHMKIGTGQLSIGKPPAIYPPVWSYCMDINLRVPLNRLSAFYQLTGNGEIETTRSSTTSWLTIVFDPPQNNGGNGGPP